MLHIGMFAFIAHTLYFIGASVVNTKYLHSKNNNQNIPSWHSSDSSGNVILGAIFLIGTLLVLVLSLAVVVTVHRSLAGSGLNPFNHTTMLHLQSTRKKVSRRKKEEFYGQGAECTEIVKQEYAPAVPVHLGEIERETSTRLSQGDFVIVFTTQ